MLPHVIQNFVPQTENAHLTFLMLSNCLECFKQKKINCKNLNYRKKNCMRQQSVTTTKFDAGMCVEVAHMEVTSGVSVIDNQQ